MDSHSFGKRCPQCLGETVVIHHREISGERHSKTTMPANPRRAVLLDNIRSAWNVGSIFRSADGFGFSHLYLCGITPTPEENAVRKTALGAEESVSWSYHKNAHTLALQLKQDGWKILALEEEPRAVPIGKQKQAGRQVLILGSEVAGVDPGLLDLADKIFYIPMRGEKRSFNVANAFSIAAYALTL